MSCLGRLGLIAALCFVAMLADRPAAAAVWTIEGSVIGRTVQDGAADYPLGQRLSLTFAYDEAWADPASVPVTLLDSTLGTGFAYQTLAMNAYEWSLVLEDTDIRRFISVSLVSNKGAFAGLMDPFSALMLADSRTAMIGFGKGDTALFSVDAATTVTPLPAALPMLASALGAGGLLWRLRRPRPAAVPARRSAP